MAFMLALIIVFNCIPNVVIYATAMELFLSEYSDYTNVHVRSKYLNPADARKLGGRAAGIPGSVGSTNGVERRNRVWKDTHKALIRNGKTDKHNFIHIIEGESRAHALVRLRAHALTRKITNDYSSNARS